MDQKGNGAGQWIMIERIIDAPRSLVWNMWTQPLEVKRWWGPEGFTAPYASIDLRIKGKYIFCMRSPDGKDYWTSGTYREIAEPEQLVYTDYFSDDKGHEVPPSNYGMKGDWPDESVVTVTLTEHRGGTRMRVRHVGFPSGDHSKDAAVGWNQSFDKMVSQLMNDRGMGPVLPQDNALIVPNDREVITTTIVDAEPDDVWMAYSDPEVIVNWWGPRVLKTRVEKLDLKKGGTWRFVNIDRDGKEYFFNGMFKEIEPRKRLLQTFEYEGIPGHILEEEIRLEPLGKRTRVVTRDIFSSTEDRDGMLETGMEASMFEIMERLGEAVQEAKRKG